MNKGVAIAVAFIAGALLSGYLESGFLNKVYLARLSVFGSADEERMSKYAALTRSLGTSETYEAALQEFLRAIDVREGMPEPGAVTDPQALTADKILTYARLAVLATDRNDPVRATNYWSEAKALCPKLRWTLCTTDKLTGVVRQLDEQSSGTLKPERP